MPDVVRAVPRDGPEEGVEAVVVLVLVDGREPEAIDDALDGLAAAMSGEGFDSYFADLIDCEPQLPDFLREKKGAEPT